MKSCSACLVAACFGLLTSAQYVSAQSDAQEASLHGAGSGGTLLLNTGGSMGTVGGTLTYNNLGNVTTSTDRTYASNSDSGVTTSGATLSFFDPLYYSSATGNLVLITGSTYASGFTLTTGVDYTLNTYPTSTGAIDTLTPTYGNPVSTVPVSATPWSSWVGTGYSPYTPAFSTPDALSVEAGAPFALGITAYSSISAYYAPNVYAAWNLPPGTNFDASRGLIAGFIAEPGTYHVTIGIGNTSGRRVKTITVTVTAPVPALVLKAFAPRASYAEGQNGEFAVYLSKATSVDLLVNYTVAGTAANGRDVKKLSGQLTIPAGETYGLIDVVPEAALANKGERTVAIKLAPGTGYTIQTPRVVRVTVSGD